MPPTTQTQSILAYLRTGASPNHPGLALRDGRLLAHGERVAQRLSEREVWITPDRLPPSAAHARATLRRLALTEGFRVYDGVKPPAPMNGFAAMPPLTVEDANLVALALRTLCVSDASSNPSRSMRAMRLANVFDRAAEGNRALADGLYASLPQEVK